jgi:hypothetical protein
MLQQAAVRTVEHNDIPLFRHDRLGLEHCSCVIRRVPSYSDHNFFGECLKTQGGRRQYEEVQELHFEGLSSSSSEGGR